MNIKKAVSWLNNRFIAAKESKYNSFKVSDFDFKTFSYMVEYIDILHKEKVTENVLFAKLYIYHLNQMIETYSYNKELDPESNENYTSFLDTMPQKELSKILDRDLSNFYLAFHNKINSDWRDALCRKLVAGKDISKEYVRERYTIDLVTSQLDLMINQALIKFQE